MKLLLSLSLLSAAAGASRVCTANEYMSHNKGSCVDKKELGDLCNAAQQCGTLLECVDEKCVPEGVPRCPDVMTEELIPAGQLAYVPEPLQGTYGPANSLAPNLYTIPGFDWEEYGYSNVGIHLHVANFTSYMNVPYVKKRWCDTKGEHVFRVAIPGVCEYDGPDPNYHWYKVMANLELWNDCFNQLPGVCRIVKVGKQGTAAEGKYVESQDSDTPSNFIQGSAPYGGAIEYLGDQVKLHWEVCPTSITNEQLVSIKTYDGQVGPGLRTCPALMEMEFVPNGRMATIPLPLQGSYNKASGITKQQARTTTHEISGFTWKAHGSIELIVEFFDDNVPSSFGASPNKVWCDQKGVHNTTVWIAGVCEFDGPDDDYYWYKVIMDLEIQEDCFGRHPGVCRIVKLGKPGTAVEGKYVESQDSFLPSNFDPRSGANGGTAPGQGGAVEYFGDSMLLHWEVCPETIAAGYENVVTTKM